MNKVRCLCCEVKKSNFVEDLVNSFLTVDDDFNGNNGPEHLCENAVKGGFKSDADYMIHVLNESESTDTEKISDFLYFFFRSDYYLGFYYDIKETEGCYYIAAAWMIDE